MSIPCKFERSVLSYDEYGVLLRSHHPEIYEAGLDDLKALRQRLRDMRDKESTLPRASRRLKTGEPGSPPDGEAGGADCAHRSRTPRARHAPCGSVSSASEGRRHTERRHASAAQSTATHAGCSRKDRQRVASDKKCPSCTRRRSRSVIISCR